MPRLRVRLRTGVRIAFACAFFALAALCAFAAVVLVVRFSTGRTSPFPDEAPVLALKVLGIALSVTGALTFAAVGNWLLDVRVVRWLRDRRRRTSRS